MNSFKAEDSDRAGNLLRFRSRNIVFQVTNSIAEMIWKWLSRLDVVNFSVNSFKNRLRDATLVN